MISLKKAMPTRLFPGGKRIHSKGEQKGLVISALEKQHAKSRNWSRSRKKTPASHGGKISIIRSDDEG